MTDYYSILGLTKNATEIEIKSAFRKLAKIYHPDKNPNDPNAKHLFALILKAYDTLINPDSRRRYDYASNKSFTAAKNYSQAFDSKKRGQKEWNITEEEIKRREYYKKHYQQVKYQSVKQSKQTSGYSDYKYILYATPIAVGLFMLIISLFSHEPETTLESSDKETPVQTQTSKTIVELKNGDKPYNGVFGAINTFNTNHVLQINNSTFYDAVVAVFDKKTNHYLQHAYLQKSYTVEFSMLPETGVYWKCVLGKNWNSNKLFANNEVLGGFDSIIQYQNWKSSPTLFNNNSDDDITILYILNEQLKNKQYISNDIEFFKH